MSKQEKSLTINLSGDEALVIFDFLSRYENILDELETDAERVALSAVRAPLEKHLVAPFKNNYVDLVEAARKRLWTEED